MYTISYNTSFSVHVNVLFNQWDCLAGKFCLVLRIWFWNCITYCQCIACPCPEPSSIYDPYFRSIFQLGIKISVFLLSPEESVGILCIFSVMVKDSTSPFHLFSYNESLKSRHYRHVASPFFICKFYQ